MSDDERYKAMENRVTCLMNRLEDIYKILCTFDSAKEKIEDICVAMKGWRDESY
jgi:hypothetical protein